MKLSRCFVFAACLAAASADFGSWKQEHGKKYASTAEEAAAKLAYAANDKVQPGFVGKISHRFYLLPCPIPRLTPTRTFNSQPDHQRAQRQEAELLARP